jgi:hypothetical protein
MNTRALGVLATIVGAANTLWRRSQMGFRAISKVWRKT